MIEIPVKKILKTCLVSVCLVALAGCEGYVSKFAAALPGGGDGVSVEQPPRDERLAMLDDGDDDAPLAPLGPVPYPADNPITAKKIELGKVLFFDPRLTGDASLSCADCHIPREGWGTAESICRGYPGAVHWRNCHTVVNTGYLDKLFWQGSSLSLEKQAKSAASGGIAGNGEKDVMEQRLRQTPYYVEAFREVFGTQRPVLADAWAAIATFERATLSQKNTPLDRYLKGDMSALTDKAIKGFEVFNGKGNCIECHNGPMLSDQKFYNLGLPRPFEWEEMGLHEITYRFELFAKGSHEKDYRNSKDDPGLYFTTKNPADKGKFRTQPLRYLSYTAPYMHAGQFYTLAEVVDFYNEGGGHNEFTESVGSKTPILTPLGLDDEEKAALVAFLEEISGDEITVTRPLIPPYEAVDGAGALDQKGAKSAGLEPWMLSKGTK